MENPLLVEESRLPRDNAIHFRGYLDLRDRVRGSPAWFGHGLKPNPDSGHEQKASTGHVLKKLVQGFTQVPGLSRIQVHLAQAQGRTTS